MAGLDSEGEIFDVDATMPQPKKKAPPAFKIYADSKIAVSKAVGKSWQVKYEAALNAFTQVHESWEEVFQYYNAHQGKQHDTPRGSFKRGDSSENVIFSNVNVMLPAVYSKNPDITCSTIDAADDPFCQSLQAFLNTAFKKKTMLNAKAKLKKAAGFCLLTNMGVVKLDFVKKDDSVEIVAEELAKIATALQKAKDIKEVKELEGQLEALEAQMEVAEPSGFRLQGVLPHWLLVDPEAELPDGSDGKYMMERTFLATEYLRARFTEKDEDGTPVLIYKPTHKAVLQGGGDRDEGMGMVLTAIEAETSMPTSHTDEERLSHIYQEMTECIWVWDKLTRRVFLFLKDDWTWPVWVWDDPLGLSRFFPYFIMSIAFSTGGTTSVGETSYYLDQQDEINDINRQVRRMRNSVFDYFFYNSDMIKDDQAEQFFSALRGLGSPNSSHVLGVRLGQEGDVKKAFMSLVPPSAEVEALFNKEPVLQSINRIANVSDALRGVQFKTNTNEKAVETYNDAVKLSVGYKVDALEDCIADLAYAVAEVAVQNYTQEDIADIVGEKYAQDWLQMTPKEFARTYNVEVVAGSTEKPTSLFKKKEAVEVAQAVGQFAKGAPGASMMIMLDMLQMAFPQVVVKPEHWDMLKREIAATMQQGISTPGGGQVPQGQPQQGQPQQNPEVERLLAEAPPQIKERAAQLAQSGAPPEQVIATLKAGASLNGQGPKRRAQ